MQYTSAPDLRGQSVGVSNETAQFYVERFLNQAGLSRTDVEFTMLTPPDIVAAFASGAIAAGWLPEPPATMAERQGVARPVATTGDLLAGVTTQTLIMAPQLATDQSHVARRFLRAYLRGQRAYYHAMNKGDGNRDMVIQSLVTHTPVKDTSLYSVMGLPSVAPNGTLDLTSWSVFQDYFIERGLQTQRIDVTQYIDGSLLQDALNDLGREP